MILVNVIILKIKIEKEKLKSSVFDNQLIKNINQFNSGSYQVVAGISKDSTNVTILHKL